MALKRTVPTRRPLLEAAAKARRIKMKSGCHRVVRGRRRVERWSTSKTGNAPGRRRADVNRVHPSYRHQTPGPEAETVSASLDARPALVRRPSEVPLCVAAELASGSHPRRGERRVYCAYTGFTPVPPRRSSAEHRCPGSGHRRMKESSRHLTRPSPLAVVAGTSS